MTYYVHWASRAYTSVHSFANLKAHDTSLHRPTLRAVEHADMCCSPKPHALSERRGDGCVGRKCVVSIPSHHVFSCMAVCGINAFGRKIQVLSLYILTLYVIFIGFAAN